MANEQTLGEVIRGGMRRANIDQEELARLACVKLEDVQQLAATGGHHDLNKLYAVLLALGIRVRLPDSYVPPNEQ